MYKVKIHGIGHGAGFCNYPTEFEIQVNDISDDEGQLFFKVRAALQTRTACVSVTVVKYEVL